LIEITEQDFDINHVVGKLNRDGVGAIVTFIGTVRDFTDIDNENGEKKRVDVQKLVYESYDDMAIQKMSELKESALTKFGIKEMAVIHRKGTLKPTENIVIIAVSAAHRKDAFSACEYAISELKKIVPIWKKEVGPNGEYWVGEEKGEGEK
jgi:molybdopterin synthase catalytic subunit